MPNYGYGYDIGRDLRSAGDDIAKGITAAHKNAMKQHQDAEGVQGLLDLARRFTVPDPKTGKPVPILKDEHYQYIKGLIDQKKYHAAGQAEAALGIGKDMIPRWQAAAAKQAAAYQKAQEEHAAMLQGPIRVTTPDGRSYLYNQHTKTYQNDPALPRNAAGQTTEEQQNFQKAMLAKQQADQNVVRTGFNAGLKAMNTTPQDLYDTTKAQPGVFVDGRGFFPTADFEAAKKGGKQVADPGQEAPAATHVRVGYEPPSQEVFVRGNKKGLPVKPGNPGHVLTVDEFNALRDTQAKLAGPTADQAWKWMNTSPEATQTDYNGNPWTPDSIDQYNKLLPGVQKQFHKQIAEGFEIPKQEVTTTTAPAQPPAAAFPQGQTPVVPSEPLPDTPPPTDEGDTEE